MSNNDVIILYWQLSSSIFRHSAVCRLCQKFVHIAHLALVWFVAVSFFLVTLINPKYWPMNRNVDLQECSTYQLHLSDWFQQSVIKCTEHFLNIQRRTPSKTNFKMVTTPLKLLSIFLDIISNIALWYVGKPKHHVPTRGSETVPTLNNKR